MYFTNIVSFILVLLIYYGLLIILFIAFAIHLYDYKYNYDDFLAFWNSKPHSHEFKTAEEANQINLEYKTEHEGHSHFNIPFDFNNI